MAAGSLPAPGTPLGPCLLECSHTDCWQTRLDAASICPECGQPIGYETRMYSEKGQLVHATCLEERVERERAQKGGAR